MSRNLSRGSESLAPIYYADIRASEDFSRQQLSKKPLNLAGGLALPVIFNSELLGVVEFYSSRVLNLKQDDIDLIEKFSRIINGLYGQYQEGRMLNLLLDSCGEGVYGLDAKGITTFVNPQTCKILGYTSEELIGYSMHEKIHHSYSDKSLHAKNDCNIYNCIYKNKPSHIEDEVFWNKEGNAVPVEYTVTPIIENKNIVGGVVSFVDVSEKRKARQQMAIISNIQNTYIKADKKTVIFEEILQHILDITESEYGFIASVHKDLKGLPYLEVIDEQHAPKELEFKSLKTLLDDMLRTKKVVISNDPSSDKQHGGLPKEHSELKSYLGVPLLGLKDDLIAMCGVANREGGYSQQLVNDLKPLTRAVSNIIESYQYYTTIEDMAKFDSLTKLFNRQFAHLKLSELIEKHRKEKTHFYIFMLDLNNFKCINDLYGAHIGDEVLVSFSARISNLLKSADFFARVGGDEFLIILEKTSDLTKLTEMASCLSKASKMPYEIHGKSILCGLTIGSVCYPLGGKTKEELLNHVSFALYNAKRKKESISFFSKKEKQLFEEIMMLESDFKQAFLKKEFCMQYQPQVNLKTGEILGLEALIRWDHPTRGLLYPDFFIDYLESLGQSEKLNEYVLEKVLTDVSVLNTGKPLNISINVSPKIADFKKHIGRLVKIVQSKQGMLKAKNLNLEFEITESSFVSHKEKALNDALKQVKKQGIKCAMDDFGMEYSSINRLIQYKFDTVKIDKVFTQKLNKRNKKPAVAVIKALIQLSKDLDFKLIAEGPETEAQVQKLLEVGCFYGQGFYFYKPMLITKARDLIKKQNST
jgi:diguanylate cyclase (GGDEF)-like protein/PAS domain S-box-containing protein